MAVLPLSDRAWSCLFMLVIAGFCESSESLEQTQTGEVSIVSIIGINKANFFFAFNLFRMAALLKGSG
jgi:NADH pyrophosphatase NudC (nudix superfamily)